MLTVQTGRMSGTLARLFAGFLLVLACLAGAGVLPGCVDMDRVSAERERGEAAVLTLKSRAVEYQTRLDALEAADPARGGLESGLESAARSREALASRVQELAALEERLKRSNSGASGGVVEIGGIGGVGDGRFDLMDLVPGPWKVAAALSLGLATSLVRSRQLREAASSIARSIDKALEEDAALAERFRLHANTLRTIQTPLAMKIVDEGQ
jgi:hypothetical protein